MFERPNSLTDTEAQALCEEHSLSPCVVDAYPVTFGGVTHVHLDLNSNEIVVFNNDDCLTIEV